MDVRTHKLDNKQFDFVAELLSRTSTQTTQSSKFWTVTNVVSIFQSIALLVVGVWTIWLYVSFEHKNQELINSNLEFKNRNLRESKVEHDVKMTVTPSSDNTLGSYKLALAIKFSNISEAPVRIRFARIDIVEGRRSGNGDSRVFFPNSPPHPAEDFPPSGSIIWEATQSYVHLVSPDALWEEVDIEHENPPKTVSGGACVTEDLRAGEFVTYEQDYYVKTAGTTSWLGCVLTIGLEERDSIAEGANSIEVRYFTVTKNLSEVGDSIPSELPMLTTMPTDKS